MGNKEDIGRNIKHCRQLRNLTQAQLGESIGLAESTISMYESGKREPDMDTIETIADVLNVRMIDIIPKATDQSFSADQLSDLDREILSLLHQYNDEEKKNFVRFLESILKHGE